MSGIDKFMEVYKPHLAHAIVNYPNEYFYTVDKLPGVLTAMRLAIEGKSFNKDSRAIKATCKELGIKHTYTAIFEFIRRAEA